MEDTAVAAQEVPLENGTGSLYDRSEKEFQRKIAKLDPGSFEFKVLVKARRKGRAYRQPIMFWPSTRERSRGRT